EHGAGSPGVDVGSGHDPEGAGPLAHGHEEQRGKHEEQQRPQAAAEAASAARGFRGMRRGASHGPSSAPSAAGSREAAQPGWYSAGDVRRRLVSGEGVPSYAARAGTEKGDKKRNAPCGRGVSCGQAPRCEAPRYEALWAGIWNAGKAATSRAGAATASRPGRRLRTVAATGCFTPVVTYWVMASAESPARPRRSTVRPFSHVSMPVMADAMRIMASMN